MMLNRNFAHTDNTRMVMETAGHGRLEKVETKTPASSLSPTVVRPMTASCLILVERDSNQQACSKSHVKMSLDNTILAIDSVDTSTLRDNN
jgi:hypothetical protein